MPEKKSEAMLKHEALIAEGDAVLREKYQESLGKVRFSFCKGLLNKQKSVKLYNSASRLISKVREEMNAGYCNQEKSGKEKNKKGGIWHRLKNHVRNFNSKSEKNDPAKEKKCSLLNLMRSSRVAIGACCVLPLAFAVGKFIPTKDVSAMLGDTGKKSGTCNKYLPPILRDGCEKVSGPKLREFMKAYGSDKKYTSKIAPESKEGYKNYRAEREKVWRDSKEILESQRKNGMIFPSGLLRKLEELCQNGEITGFGSPNKGEGLENFIARISGIMELLGCFFISKAHQLACVF